MIPVQPKHFITVCEDSRFCRQLEKQFLFVPLEGLIRLVSAGIRFPSKINDRSEKGLPAAYVSGKLRR